MKSRRQFLQQTALAGAALTVAPSWSLSASSSGGRSASRWVDRAGTARD
ncbi:twin-arginine translocation signal domain-containing protein [Croceiramulus getboli]